VQDASASKSGLISVGDQIVEVDGARVQGYSPVMLVNLLCGPKGTSVKLGLRRAGGAPHESGDFGASVEELVLERDSIPSKLLLVLSRILPATVLECKGRAHSEYCRLRGCSTQECCGEIGEDIARPRAYKAAASRERERSLLSTRLKLREDPFLVGGYACAGCEETFVKWRDCLRHMRSEHHVRHDLFPYVRNAKTKEVTLRYPGLSFSGRTLISVARMEPQIWVDRPMDKRLRLLLRIYPSSSRCEPGTSPSNQIDADIHADGGESSQHGDKGAVELNSDLEERRAQAAPVDPFVIVERLGVGDIPVNLWALLNQ
jgi:hypothetical protein